MKRILLLPLTLIGISLACAPKKHGPVTMAPTAAGMKNTAMTKGGVQYEKNDLNKELEEAVKSVEISVEKVEGGSYVEATFEIDPGAKVLPEGHGDEVVLGTINDGQSAMAPVLTEHSDVSGAIICQNDCNEVVVWLKIDQLIKDGGETKDLSRLAGFGYDTVAKKIIWKTPEEPEEE